ncbi:MAG: PepSY domain-containing protein [Oscillospiraceae bacterium]
MKLKHIYRHLPTIAAVAVILSGCSLFYITRSKALSIALGNEGISGENCVFVRCEIIEEEGTACWKIAFYKDSLEYDYTIDARSGDILENDWDIDGFTPPTERSPNEGIPV